MQVSLGKMFSHIIGPYGFKKGSFSIVVVMILTQAFFFFVQQVQLNIDIKKKMHLDFFAFTVKLFSPHTQDMPIAQILHCIA